MYRANRVSAMLHVLIFATVMMVSLAMNAEGTREAAPNGSITIDGNITTDIAALHLDHPRYNRFGSYSNPDANNRLRVRIVDPGEECVYLGFSIGHLNRTTPTPPQVTFEFRVKDPNGNIVYGPITINPLDANISGWSDAFAGPSQINGPSGYDAMLVSSADLMSQGWTGAGDYYIEFREATGDALLIDFWDITVANCSGTFPEEKKGRVWSYNWAIFAINDFGFPVRPFNGAFYVCAPDPDNVDAAFVTQIDFNGAGFRPAAFNVAFNSFGSMNTGNIITDRRSVDSLNATQPEYAIFLNDPTEFCETAVIGDVELLGVTRCNLDDYCIKFTSSKKGQIILLLDFDGPDDVYTPGTADLLITTEVNDAQVGTPTCIDWDGLDGLGNPITEDPGTQIPVVISYAQGIYHFPIYDAEFMDNGFRINAIRPIGPTPLLFYDDSNIRVESGSGEPPVQLQGCTVPCHRWSVFIDPNVPGFGNLNTINSWWFSQLIVRKDVFVIPSFFACEIDGPPASCDGDTATLYWKGNVMPPGADEPTLLSTMWTGPEIIGSSDGLSIDVVIAGTYTVNATWLTLLGDTCGATCSFDLIVIPTSDGAIDTLIGYSDTLYVNGEEYTESGQYEQVLIGANGCDSVLIITLSVPKTVVYYDLDACASNPADNTNVDYSEFTAAYPDTLDCATISAGIVHRVDPNVNTHSCTPGVGLSRAMCVSSREACDYSPGTDKSVVFEVTITPDDGKPVSITSFSFYEKAPEMFDWIDGNSGENNYPTLYGVRVLKNGAEIFQMSDIQTSNSWSEQRFDFLSIEAFTVDVISTFQFELLGYCLIDNGAPVAAWDIDEITVQVGCAIPPPMGGFIGGSVFSIAGEFMQDVKIKMSQDLSFNNTENTITNADGVYLFENAAFGEDHFVRGLKNDDSRNGLSTLDILLMQKHILGIQPFKSAYQFIAGDVNRDNNISATDILDLRKLLLGQIDEFPRNESWRFGNAKFEMSMADPWIFQSIIELQNLDSDYLDAYFVGIKIGDVSGEVNSALGQGDLQLRGNSDVVLEMSDRFIEAGSNVILYVSGRGLEDVRGMQFSLRTNGAEIEEVDGINMSINKANYTNMGGLLNLSWGELSGNGFEADEVLFSIKVKANRSGRISDFLQIDTRSDGKSSSSVEAEAYIGDNLDVKNVILSFGPEDLSEIPVENVRIAPNPFSTTTNIQISTQTDGPVRLSFYDISGKLLFARSEVLQAGAHDFEISNDDLKIDSGVVVCRITCGGVSVARRLVVVAGG